MVSNFVPLQLLVHTFGDRFFLVSDCMTGRSIGEDKIRSIGFSDDGSVLLMNLGWITKICQRHLTTDKNTLEAFGD